VQLWEEEESPSPEDADVGIVAAEAGDCVAAGDDADGPSSCQMLENKVDQSDECDAETGPSVDVVEHMADDDDGDGNQEECLISFDDDSPSADKDVAMKDGDDVEGDFPSDSPCDAVVATSDADVAGEM